MDAVSKWLYLTRAGVLPMTLVSAAVAGLVAVFRGASVAWGWFALAAVGLVLAHMANNLMNDLFDLEVGTDRADYPRNLYSPHPVLSGVISRRGLALCALVVNFGCLAIMVVLTIARGWAIPAFALSGFLLSAAYTAPPLRLKKHGLGEPTVLVVWGPLMVGGTYYAATGQIPGAVVLASLPYAVLCTTVLMGKHIDKIPWDAPDGTHTLPVLLGEARSRRITQAMFATFFVSIIALVAARVLPVASLLVFLSFPVFARVWKAYDEPKPATSPGPNPVWPLWFAPHSFLLTRRAGGLFAIGLVIGAIAGW
ncbi:MAG: 1,4-dihydroxy-2-naphthoate octaprenyltransferase [Actinomycetia bacterium]|nr:1,4-dihydroxy-2-naphthoate octaprenyltransferase [Actinomycetes bacterium]